MWRDDNYSIDVDDDICNNCGCHTLLKDNNQIFCESCMTVQSRQDVDMSKYDENMIFSTKNQLFNTYNAIPSMFIKTKKISHAFSIIRTFKWSRTTHQERKIRKVFVEVSKIMSNIDEINGIKLDDDQIVAEVTQNFQTINNYLNFRHPITFGIYAMCLYYVMKNKYIILTNEELVTIFSISKRILSAANRKINNILLNKHELRKKFNTIPLQPSSFINTIKYKFPKLKNYMQIIEATLNRVDNHFVSTCNVPKSIVSGIIYNYTHQILSNDKKNITQQKNDIIK